jgi:hypothetical protein
MMPHSRKRLIPATDIRRAARRRVVVHASFLLAATLFGACIRPVVDTVTPAVKGTYQRNDGTPFSNLRVATTAELRDSTCSQGVARATTDSTGAFQLDSTTVRRGFWAYVWRYYVRQATYKYGLCVGQSDSALRRVDFAGESGYYHPRDRVTCLEWMWQGRTQPICGGFGAEGGWTIGGRWTYGADTGTFRVVQPSVPGMDSIYVQWLARSASGPPYTYAVRATRAAKPNVRALSVWFRGSCMEVWGYGPMRVALGPPGEIGPPGSC